MTRSSSRRIARKKGIKLQAAAPKQIGSSIRHPFQIVFRLAVTLGPPPDAPTLYKDSLFNDSRLKVHRALMHAHDASEMLKAFIDMHANSLGRKQDPDGQWRFRVAIPSAPPLSFALTISDAIRCLRSSLDYLVAALARHHGIRDNKIIFPVNEIRKNLEQSFADPVSKEACPKCGKKERRDRSDTFVRLVEKCPDLRWIILDKIQPYSREDGANEFGDLIYRINKLDNSDKHRLMTPVIGGTSVKSFVFVNKRTNSTLMLENIGFAGDDHAFPIDFDTEIYADGDFEIDVIFPPGSILEGCSVLGKLNEAADFISRIIEIFQSHFQGERPEWPVQFLRRVRID